MRSPDSIPLGLVRGRRPWDATVRLWLAVAVMLAAQAALAQPPDTIVRVKASVVAVGTVQRLRSPQFQFFGTGFAVGDGGLIATNAHVIGRPLAAAAVTATGTKAAATGGGPR
jgi:serine protease Do